MMVNTVLELADVDAGLNELATHKLDVIEKAFARAFERARATGELDARHSPKELASLVMTINMGLRVQSRQHSSAKQLKPLIENSLSLLGLAS